MTKKKHPAPDKAPKNSSGVSLLIAFFGLLCLFLLASFFPSLRVWGVNWWAFFPTGIAPGLFVLSGALGILIYYLFCKRETQLALRLSHSSVVAIMAASGLCLLAGFWFLPSATHFLGDGYQILSLVASGGVSIKLWDYGASVLCRWLFDTLGVQGLDGARLVFRVLSFGSGLLMLVTLAVFSLRLTADPWRKLVLFLGLSSSGYMVQFFGYVENYSLLLVCIMTFLLLGLEAASGRRSPWWMLLPLFLGLFNHIFAISLVPGFIYLVLRPTTVGQWFTQIEMRTKRMAALVLVLVALTIHQILYHSSYFFTFAFLPLLPDKFVVDDDWLLSIKHLVDTCNLVLLLTPGVLLAILLLDRKRLQILREPSFLFLLMEAAAAFVLVFAFNPGIGMPRNWDLFAILGPPLALLCFLFLLDQRWPLKMGLTAALLAVLLNIMTLAPRVVALASVEMGVSHFRTHLELDRARSRNARRLLIDHYYSVGDSASAAREQLRAERDYPESVMGTQARELLAQGKVSEAMARLRHCLEINPIYYDAYGNLGACYLQLGRLDSALEMLQIADGLNPRNAQTLANIGTVHLRAKDFVAAEEQFLASLLSDSTQQNALMGLASVCVLQSRPGEALEHIRKLAQGDQLPPEYFGKAAEALADKGAFGEASTVLQLARTKGLSTDAISEILGKYPQLHLAL